MIEPSPRPWYRDHIYYITDPNRRDVANTYFPCHQHDVDEANARLIVRAVNAYDSLLAACKAVEALLDQGLALGMSVEDVKVAYDILHAEIKKAEADDEYSSIRSPNRPGQESVRNTYKVAEIRKEQEG